jgi:hypothetical protein
MHIIFSFAKSDDGSSFPAPMREETDHWREQ